MDRRGITALAAAFAPINPGSSTLWVFAAAGLCAVGPPAAVMRWVGVLLGVLAVEAWLAPLSVWYWAPAAVFAVVIAGVKIHYSELHRADASLRLAHEEVARLAKVAERERIGRDLHDLLGHSLTLIALKSELAGKLVGRDPGAAGREIGEVERISREALAEVRSAVAGYRSADLAAELAGARLALIAAGVEPRLAAAPVDLPRERASALALALREAVTNVVRHARASTCTVRLAAAEARVVLEVEDDGCGGVLREGSGLAGMRERIAALGGAVERRSGAGGMGVVGGAGSGTLLRVTVPALPSPPGRPASPALVSSTGSIAASNRPHRLRRPRRPARRGRPEIASPSRGRLRYLRDHAFVGYIEDLIFTPELDYLNVVGSNVVARLRSTNLLAQVHATLAGSGLCILPAFMASAFRA